MKMKGRLRLYWGLGLIGIFVLVGIVKAANIANITNVKALMLDSGLYFGDSQDPAYTTLPTTTTADLYSVKVPFYNGSAASTARGSVIIASVTATSNVYGSMTTVTSTTTVLGISDGVYTSGSKGFMTIEGYAAVLTTGTVNIGDILVSSATLGYAGFVAPSSATFSGAMIGKALSVGTAAGGLTLVLIQ